jgi:uncharacterized damage-inducible protein DinB
MDARIEPLVEILRANTRLFLNCLRDVDAASGATRVSDRTNHMTFIAVHLVDARDYLLTSLGGDRVAPFAAYELDAVSSIEEVGDFPPLEDVTAAWREVSRRLTDRLNMLDGAVWDAEAPMRFPVDDPTTLGMLAFLMQHDSYHIGQLAFLRKHLGFGAMSYDEPEGS